MNLLAIEIDLDSFFDVNLIVFTTISFVFSVVVIFFLVFALRPLSARASIAQGRIPEKLNIMYIRLLIYGFAQFMAFVADVFLVVFGHNYRLPWFTTSVFLTLILYKLVFVLFKDFKELGYDAKGITSTLKAATKIATDKNLDSLTDTIEKMPMEIKNDKTKQSKIRYKKSTIRSKLPFLIITLFIIFGFRGSHLAYAPNDMTQSKSDIIELLSIPATLPEPVIEEDESINTKIRIKWKGKWIDMNFHLNGKDVKITNT